MKRLIRVKKKNYNNKTRIIIIVYLDDAIETN